MIRSGYHVIAYVGTVESKSWYELEPLKCNEASVFKCQPGTPGSLHVSTEASDEYACLSRL